MRVIRFCLLMGFVLIINIRAYANDDFKVFFTSYRDVIMVDKDSDYIDLGWWGGRTIDRSRKGEIYVMDPDGSNQKRLTDNKVIEGEIKFTNDKMFYVNYEIITEKIGNKDIYRMNFDGSENEPLLDDFDKFEYDYAINSDGNKMVYILIDADKMVFPNYKFNENEIYLLDLETMQNTRLTNNDKNDYFPEFFPNENKIIFLRDREIYTGAGFQVRVRTKSGIKYFEVDGMEKYGNLYTMDLETLEENPFSDHDYNFGYPKVSPDGNYIASTIEKPDRNKYFVLLGKDGSKLFELSGIDGSCFSYKFLPDSSGIGVLCGKYEKTQMYLINIVDNYNHYQVAPDNYYVTSFDFTPDGGTIYFSAVKDKKLNPINSDDNDNEFFGESEIYRISVHGEDIEQLTANVYDVSSVLIKP